jgi:hypothetical protein
MNADIGTGSKPFTATLSGYYLDRERMVADAVKMSAYDAPGVFFTLNPTLGALHSRSADKFIERAKTTTADNEIGARRWILVDFDAVRPAGISSTDEEHQLAHDRARQCRDYLVGLGWSASAIVLADSGNGGHALIRVDLANDDAALDLVKRVLQTLDARFSDKAVKVDVSVCNAARITKCYGTPVRKGSNTAYRPHRLSRVLEATDALTAVAHEQLVALAATATAPETKDAPKTGKKHEDGPFDMVGLIERHPDELLVKGEPKSEDGGTRWQLMVCPFDPEEKNSGNASLFVSAEGMPGFKCFRERCAEHDIKALFKLLGEKGRRPTTDDHPGTREAESVMSWIDERFVQIMNRDLVAENKTGILRSPEKFAESRLSDVWVEWDEDKAKGIKAGKMPAGKYWLRFHENRPKCHDVGLFPGEPKIGAGPGGEFYNLWAARDALPLDAESVKSYKEQIRKYFIPLLKLIFGSYPCAKACWYMNGMAIFCATPV